MVKKKFLFAFLMILICTAGITLTQPVAGQRSLTESRLVAGDPTANARLGTAVAIEGGTAVVGAPGANGSTANSGAAYVFRYQNGAWTQSAKLVASDGQALDAFGKSVAIQNNTIIVGATGHDAAGANAGAAYVFTFNGAVWTETDKLLPSAAGDAYFGFSVAIDGSTTAVGAPYSGSGFTNSGSVYLFEAGSGGWPQTDRFATNTGGAVLSDLFGWDVALDGDLLVVGAYLADTAYLYARTTTGWEADGELSGSDTQVNDRFGYAVSTDGTRIMVGATHDDDMGTNAGAAYLFVMQGGAWTQETKLLPQAAFNLNGSNFGWDAAVSGSYAVVGAPNSQGLVDAEESGNAFYYTRNGASWGPSSLLASSRVALFDHFGISVALSGGSVLAGAPDDDDVASNAGAAFGFGEFTSDPGEPGLGEDLQTCIPEEQTTEEVYPGVTLTWDSAFWCSDAPDEGMYEFNVQIDADASNSASAEIEAVTLTHTTPRPLGQAPEASVDEVTGLPTVIAAGEDDVFSVLGDYELAIPGDARLANLHFCATGRDNATGEPFYLGLNVFLREPGTEGDQQSTSSPAPVISNVTAIPGMIGATITWQTNIPATSEVMVSPSGSAGLPKSVNRGCLVAQNHQILLNGLLPDREYTFQVRSKTGVDAMATSTESVFSTTDGTLIFLPMISP